MVNREKYLEYIYLSEREQECIENHVENLDCHDKLVGALVDINENAIYDFDLATELFLDSNGKWIE